MCTSHPVEVMLHVGYALIIESAFELLLYITVNHRFMVDEWGTPRHGNTSSVWWKHLKWRVLRGKNKERAARCASVFILSSFFYLVLPIRCNVNKMCLEIKPIYVNWKHMGREKEDWLPIAVQFTLHWSYQGESVRLELYWLSTEYCVIMFLILPVARSYISITAWVSVQCDLLH